MTVPVKIWLLSKRGLPRRTYGGVMPVRVHFAGRHRSIKRSESGRKTAPCSSCSSSPCGERRNLDISTKKKELFADDRSLRSDIVESLSPPQRDRLRRHNREIYGCSTAKGGKRSANQTLYSVRASGCLIRSWTTARHALSPDEEQQDRLL